MLSHRLFIQVKNCNWVSEVSVTLLPLLHNIPYTALCRSKNRAAPNLCGHLRFCNLRHVFQRTGIFVWSNDLGDNSHNWKLLMPSLIQHCKHFCSLIFNFWIYIVVVITDILIAIFDVILWPFPLLPLLPRYFKNSSRIQKVLIIEITDQAKFCIKMSPHCSDQRLTSGFNFY